MDHGERQRARGRRLHRGSSGTIVFPAGSGNGSTQAVSVPILSEEAYELAESFLVRLSSPSGALLGAIPEFTATLVNDDGPPTVSVADVVVAERSTGWDLLVNVTLSAPSYQSPTVDWATVPGSATSPADYTASQGTASFGPDAASASISIPIVGDGVYERDEAFTVQLSNPAHTSIADGSGQITLREDDPPAFSVSDAHGPEGDDGQPKLAFEISVEGPSHLPMSVAYQSVNCTALSRADYQAVSGKLEVPAEWSGPATVNVLINANTAPEPLKVFQLEIYDPTNAVLGDALGSGSILNDDGSLGLRARADFDGDGENDLLFADRITGDVEVWPMNGNARRGKPLPLEPARPVAGNWNVVGVADFDGDNQPDVLWHNRDSGALSIWLMNGVVRANGVLLDGIAELTWQVVATADIDRDGKADIVWWNETTGEALVWFMDGTVFRSARRPSPPAPQEGALWQLQAVADLTADGQSDLIWRHLDSGALVYWQMEGLVRTGGGYLTPDRIDPAWAVVASFDIDPDLQADLLAQHVTSGDVLVVHQNGAQKYCGSAIAPRPGATLQLVGPR